MDDKLDRTLKRVEKYLAQKKYDLSIELLKPLVEKDPGNITLINMLANACDLAGKSFLALKYFNESGDFYMKKEMYDKAIAIYKRITKTHPDDPESYEKIANVHLLQKNINEATTYLKSAAEKYRFNGEPQKARDVLDIALQHNPDNQRLRLELIEIYKANGENEKAIEQYLVFVQNFISRGDLQGAKTILENILKLDENNLKALTKLAEISSGLGDKDQTLKLYEKIFSIDRSNPDALYSFAQEYYNRFGDAQNAAEMLKRAHRLKPDDLRVLLLLKQIVPSDLEVRQALKVYYLEKGDKRKAIMEIMSMADIFAESNNQTMAEKLRQKASEMLREIDVVAKDSPPPMRQREQVVPLNQVAPSAPAQKTPEAPAPAVEQPGVPPKAVTSNTATPIAMNNAGIKEEVPIPVDEIKDVEDEVITLDDSDMIIEEAEEVVEIDIDDEISIEEGIKTGAEAVAPESTPPSVPVVDVKQKVPIPEAVQTVPAKPKPSVASAPETSFAAEQAKPPKPTPKKGPSISLPDTIVEKEAPTIVPQPEKIPAPEPVNEIKAKPKPVPPVSKTPEPVKQDIKPEKKPEQPAPAPEPPTVTEIPKEQISTPASVKQEPKPEKEIVLPGPEDFKKQDESVFDKLQTAGKKAGQEKAVADSKKEPIKEKPFSGQKTEKKEEYDAVVPLPHDPSEDESVFIEDVDIDPETLSITVKTSRIEDAVIPEKPARKEPPLEVSEPVELIDSSEAEEKKEEPVEETKPVKDKPLKIEAEKEEKPAETKEPEEIPEDVQGLIETLPEDEPVEIKQPEPVPEPPAEEPTPPEKAPVRAEAGEQSLEDTIPDMPQEMHEELLSAASAQQDFIDEIEINRKQIDLLQQSVPHLQESEDFSLTGVFEQINVQSDEPVEEEKKEPVVNFSDDTQGLSVQMNSILNEMIVDETHDDAEDDETIFNLAMSYMEMRLFDDAIDQFKLIVNKPAYAVKAGQFLGLAYSNKQDDRSALEWYQKILPKIPDESESKLEVTFTVGDLYLGLEDYRNAYSYFMQLYKKDPSYPGLMQKLEYISRRMENK